MNIDSGKKNLTEQPSSTEEWTFGSRLSILINKLGMTKKGFAQKDLVAMSGITKGAISQYISGKMTPGEEKIQQLAKALGVTEAWLKNEKEPVDISPENLFRLFSAVNKDGKAELIKRGMELTRLEEFLKSV